MNNMLDKKIEIIQNIFKDKNVYLVGGCLRDLIMGLEPKDIDLATDMNVIEIVKTIEESGRKAYTQDSGYGCIRFKVQPDSSIKSELVEITTFRFEKYEENNRKPIVSIANNLLEDLQRRDFTINALALDIKDYPNLYKTIDYFEAENDIKEKILKSVGNPNKRFKEDPLRILRAFRFAGKYNLVFDINTLEATENNRCKLLYISKERIKDEMDKILSLEKPSLILRIMMQRKIFDIILPILCSQYEFNQNNPYHEFTLWEHTLRTVDLIPKENLLLRWAGLLHDIGKPYVANLNEGISRYNYHEKWSAKFADEILTGLRFSNKEKGFIITVIENHINEDSILKKYDDLAKRN